MPPAAAAFPYGFITGQASAAATHVLPFLNLGLVVGVALILMLILSRSASPRLSVALVENLTHAMIVITTVLATCALALAGHASDTTVATILGAAIGYAAGKGGASPVQVATTRPE